MNKRYIIATFCVLGGWAFFVAVSLWRVGDSFDGLPSLDSQNVEDVPVGVRAQSAEMAPRSAVDSEPPILEEVSPLEGEGLAITAGPQTSNGIWAPVPREKLCANLRFSGFVPVLMDDTGDLSLPFGFHMSLSDNALRARADADEDGLAQYVYAHRILDLEVVPGHIFLEPEIVLDRFDSVEDEDFQLATEYMISAVRNQNWGAAQRLASVYFPFDKIESHAWLLVNEMAGGNGLQVGSLTQGAKRTIVQQLEALTEEERDSSFVRASELVTEFELIDGLLPPDDCLEAPQL